MHDGNVQVIAYLGKHSGQARVNLVTTVFCGLGPTQGAVIGRNKISQIYELSRLCIRY